MKKVVMVDGGVGRVMCAVPAIERLAAEHEVMVVTHWGDVFLHNTSVSRLYHPSFPYLFDDVVKGNHLIAPEPYHLKEYYDGGIHLVDAFDILINGDVQVERKPALRLGRDEDNGGRSTIEALRKDKGKPVVILQPYTATYNKDMGSDPSGRSMTPEVLNAILDNIPATFINFGTVPIENPNVVNLELELRKFFSMTAHADYCLGVDSVMCHVAAAFDRVGTFFYGPTDSKQLGYERFLNLTRTGYPRGHQSFRIQTNPMLNAGAMDFTKSEVDAAIAVVRDHMVRCGVLPKDGDAESTVGVAT